VVAAIPLVTPFGFANKLRAFAEILRSGRAPAVGDAGPPTRPAEQLPAVAVVGVVPRLEPQQQ
jgi:hypothetical protein